MHLWNRARALALALIRAGLPDDDHDSEGTHARADTLVRVAERDLRRVQPLDPWGGEADDASAQARVYTAVASAHAAAMGASGD